MRGMIIFIILMFSFIGIVKVAKAAEPLLILQWTNNTTIFLSKTPCIVKNLKGSAAVVQKIYPNGKEEYVKGCWTYDPKNNDLVKIDWEPNQYSKGREDFAVIEMAKFTYIEK